MTIRPMPIGRTMGILIVATITLVGTQPAAAQCEPIQVEKLGAEDGTGGDLFGFEVAVSGPWLAISAMWDDVSGSNSGSAYVFRRTESGWIQHAKLAPDDGAANDNFGRSLDIDGDTIVIGAQGVDDAGFDSGSIYIYHYDGNDWIQQAKFSPGGAQDLVGWACAVNGDTVVAGALHDDDEGTDAGAAYVYVRDGNTWSQEIKLTGADTAAGDDFSHAVAVNGDTILIGAYQDDDNGSSSGSAYVFVNGEAGWTQTAKLTASDAQEADMFGRFLTLRGDTALIGAPFDEFVTGNSGSAYVFERSGDVWTQQAKFISDDAQFNDWFGSAVDLGDDTALVGVFNHDDNGTDSGAAYIFKRVDGIWLQEAELLANDGAAGDLFGADVALTCDTVIVGAYWDDDNGVDSGSTYIYDLQCKDESCVDCSSKLDPGGPMGPCEECPADCNDNGVADVCDLGNGTSSDCNDNVIPDECDVATGASLDCNDNLVPDECEPDCNDNNIADSCDIASGSSTDEDGNDVPDECHAILRVPTDFETIQAAIDAAEAGDTVFISDGTYSGPGNTELDFGGVDLLAKSVNGPGDCIIDGQNSARAFLFQSGESRAAIVDGFTIVNGLAAQGGAINCIQDSSPTIRDCVFADNLASDKGGAVHSDSSGPLITRCKFFGNAAQGNRGGGAVYVRNSSNQGQLAIDNCLMVGNSASNGGAIYFLGSTASIRHCTITGNSANSGGALFSTASANPVLTHSILWHDSAPVGPEITIGSVTTLTTVAYSNVEGGAKNVAGNGTLIWEQGNIGEDSKLHDPRFVDADGPDDDPATLLDNDYHLLMESPSVDTGDPAFTLELGAVDLDGRARLKDGDGDGELIVDMGCFERGICPADIDGDGAIAPFDLAMLLGAWGPCPNPDACPADLNADGVVNPLDLATLLGAWGPCP